MCKTILSKLDSKQERILGRLLNSFHQADMTTHYYSSEYRYDARPTILFYPSHKVELTVSSAASTHAPASRILHS